MSKEFVLLPKQQYKDMVSTTSAESVETEDKGIQTENLNVFCQEGKGLVVQAEHEGEIPGILDKPPVKKRKKGTVFVG